MWLDYARATQDQQATFRSANPKLGPAWDRYRMWLTKDGSISRRRGQWEWTAVFAKLVDDNGRRELRSALTGEGIRSKGDLQDFSACTFHFAPEK